MNRLFKLLVIDDDVVDRLQLRRALKSCGIAYELAELENPKSSLEIPKDGFDVIFLDYLLPGRNGLALLREMRDNGVKTPVVVITSQGNESIAVECMKAGASDYIVKNEITGQLLGQVFRSMIQMSAVIREREQAVEALRISESRLEEAQRIAKIGNWEYNFADHMVHWSDEIYNILQLDSKKSSPSLKLFMNSVHEEDRKLIVTARQTAVEGLAFNIDLRAVTPGGVKYLNTQGYAIKDSNNITIKIVGTLQDVTERKLSAQETMKAWEQAENSMKVREIFLANMSHEIRTPMNAILGFTGLLYETDLSPEQKEYIDTIHFSGENLLVVINDVLDLSKIQSGKMTIEKCEFAMHELLKGVISVMQPKIQEKRLKLISHIDEHLPAMIKGDPVRLNQILTNLLANAIKFTATGSVTIEVKCMPSERQDLLIQFRIIDTGIGIPEDKQHSIFENFVQASADTTRKYGGSGLGLAIVKNLVELQEGRISVESIAGKGATFTVNLLFERTDTTRHITSEISALPNCFEELRHACVLVVEDNAVNQLLVKKVLQKTGCKVDIATNGLEAIQYVQANKYDVVLMDIQMPEMDGYAATEFIRKRLPEPLCQIPIIAMTAHAFGEDVNRCLAAGMNDHISKPFKAEDLCAKIVRSMEKSDPFKSLELHPDNSAELAIDLTKIYELSDGDADYIKEGSTGIR